MLYEFIILYAISSFLPREVDGSANQHKELKRIYTEDQITSIRIYLNSTVLSAENAFNYTLSLETIGVLLLNTDIDLSDNFERQRNEAFKHFGDLLSKTKNARDVEYRLNMYKGEHFIELGVYQDADKYLTLAENFATSSADIAIVKYMKGIACLHFGKIDDAIELLESSIHISPSRLHTYLPLVQAYR